MESSRQSVSQHEEEPLPFIIHHLPEFALKKAVEELKETPVNHVKGLSELRSTATNSNSTSGVDFHDDLLRQFLRRNKYDVEKSFSQLQNYVNLRRKHDSLFRSLSAEDLASKTAYQCATLFPKRCRDGCTILNIQIGKFDTDVMPLDDFKRLAMLTITQTLRDPMTQINGFKCIYDFKGTTLKHLMYCTPQNLIFQYHAAMSCFPARYKEVHFVNESVVLRALWAVVRNFISSKMRNRVHFHSAPAKLLDFFPRSVLPFEYGGDLKDYYMGEYIQLANKEYGECTMEGQSNYY